MASKDDGDSYITQEMLDRLTPDQHGRYSVRYRRKKEVRGVVYEDLVAKFSVCGEVANIDADEGLIYIRYVHRDSAIRALEKFGKTLRLKVPLQKCYSETAGKQGFKFEMNGKQMPKKTEPQADLKPIAKIAEGMSRKKAKDTIDEKPLTSKLKELMVEEEDEDTALSENGLSNLLNDESEQKPVKQLWWKKA